MQCLPTNIQNTYPSTCVHCLHKQTKTCVHKLSGVSLFVWEEEKAGEKGGGGLRKYMGNAEVGLHNNTFSLPALRASLSIR